MTSSVARTLSLARRFAVHPRVASRLAREGCGAGATLLDDENLETTARNALLLREAADVTRTLAEAGIPTIALKGAALLAHGVGAELGDRHTDDVDVLVPTSLRDAAVACLCAAGYVLDSKMTRLAVDGRPIVEQEVRAGDHAAPGLVAPSGIPIDVHDRMPDAMLATFDELKANTLRIEAGAGWVCVPSGGALLAQICEHIVLHHQARPSYLPRHVADLASLEAHFGVRVWLDARGAGSAFAIRMSERLLRVSQGGGGLVAAVLLPSEAARVAAEVCWEAYDVFGRARRDLIMDPRRILTKVFPAPEYIAASYSIDAKDPMLPLYYVHRLATLRWLFRPFRG